MTKMTLKMLRVKEDLNQAQAGKKVGVSADTWGHWERGQTVPDVKRAYDIAEAFNVHIDDIIFLKNVAV
ncbi:helix-turn-helix transcriptional regulator [Streptococcus dysgalactiae]|uniref:XRE family transcriptional regulator n=1 Tax=Streptococcus dysgalactiae subsp. equisimilis TaxID=119602 RepID=A0A9X8SXI6_STREQ|nr:helix-turn-helix transcriptional regulator [Streptococcus dysgalactiae]SQF66303.1 XRE family transcriptional regulator [Streptococcus dysgalactiae subsp. equisimilis]VEF04387.1 XRE family transcriptional regulator [Streptococcus dysgalactiae subsp. equisimilis]